jgi:alpha-amylase/alpha-mannosidase (GH57 family)
MNDEKPVLDKYGRDAGERTIELHEDDAETVNKWADALGKTYDEAIRHLIKHGNAEVTRLEKTRLKNKQKTLTEQKREIYEQMLRVNPALAANPEFVDKMLADLGIKPSK